MGSFLKLPLILRQRLADVLHPILEATILDRLNAGPVVHHNSEGSDKCSAKRGNRGMAQFNCFRDFLHASDAPEFLNLFERAPFCLWYEKIGKNPGRRGEEPV